MGGEDQPGGGQQRWLGSRPCASRDPDKRPCRARLPLPRGPLPPPPGRPGGEGRAQHGLCPQTSLLTNCQAPRRPWLASHMRTVFISLLCFPSFLGAAVFLCYAVWQ